MAMSGLWGIMRAEVHTPGEQPGWGRFVLFVAVLMEIRDNKDNYCPFLSNLRVS